MGWPVHLLSRAEQEKVTPLGARPSAVNSRGRIRTGTGVAPRAYALNLTGFPVGKKDLFEKLRIQRGIPLFAREALLGRMAFQHHQSELAQQC